MTCSTFLPVMLSASCLFVRGVEVVMESLSVTRVFLLPGLTNHKLSITEVSPPHHVLDFSASQVGVRVSSTHVLISPLILHSPRCYLQDRCESESNTRIWNMEPRARRPFLRADNAKNNCGSRMVLSMCSFYMPVCA